MLNNSKLLTHVIICSCTLGPNIKVFQNLMKIGTVTK